MCSSDLRGWHIRKYTLEQVLACVAEVNNGGFIRDFAAKHNLNSANLSKILRAGKYAGRTFVVYKLLAARAVNRRGVRL